MRSLTMASESGIMLILEPREAKLRFFGISRTLYATEDEVALPVKITSNARDLQLAIRFSLSSHDFCLALLPICESLAVAPALLPARFISRQIPHQILPLCFNLFTFDNTPHRLETDTEMAASN